MVYLFEFREKYYVFFNNQRRIMFIVNVYLIFFVLNDKIP